MNVFEDLIVELQEENLLEQTVIDEQKTPFDPVPGELPAPAFLSNGSVEPKPLQNGFNEIETTEDQFVETEPEDNGYSATAASLNGSPEVERTSDGFVEIDAQVPDEAIHITADSDLPVESLPADVEGQDAAATDIEEPSFSAETPRPAPAQPKIKQPRKKDSEFFQKRAVAEVAGLQMVDHVLTGVEREYMKVVPNAFDDFNAKKALNSFLQAGPEGQAEAEFSLMQETEAWCSALAARDAKVPVSSLRLYCENTKPALSSQALLSIARFYRNLPYSEPVRAKFDFVMTRLFSRPAQDDKRVCLFDRVESLDHINKLYAEWSSVPLYTAEDDESKVVLTALSFEDLAVEAENASSFDQLITSDFFGRLRLFKESISELFFAPSVTSAAIEANVRIGNAYVVLIAREREKLDESTIQLKYLGFDDQTVSDATAQSLGLVDLLTRSPEPVEEQPTEVEEKAADKKIIEQPVIAPKSEKKRSVEKTEKPEGSFLARVKANAFHVNRWVLIVSILLTAASFGIYVWANYFAESRVTTSGVANASVSVPGFSEHIKAAKISNEMLYVHLLATWDSLPKKKRLDMLQQVYQAGEKEGWTKVQLLTHDGKDAGFASQNRLEVPDM